MLDRTRRCAGLFGGLALVGVIGGCEIPEQINSPSWSGPTATQRGQEFTPEQAIKKHVDGWVLVQCRAGPDEVAENCSILAEASQGWGFGAAALRMSPNFTARSPLPGYPLPKLGAPFTVPVVFCANEQKKCNKKMTAEQLSFRASAGSISAMIGDGRCQEAEAAAATLGQPRFSAYVTARCAAAGH